MKKKKEKLHNPREEEIYPDEEQGILKDKTKEQTEEEMQEGELDKDIYTEEGQELLEADDEIQPWEEGFIEGASGPGQLGKDALTGEPLRDVEEVVEMEIDRKLYRFVSQENAQKFRKKKEQEKKKGRE